MCSFRTSVSRLEMKEEVVFIIDCKRIEGGEDC